MANVSPTSTMYFTSRKNRFAADRSSASDAVKPTMSRSKNGTHRRFQLTPTPPTMNTMMTTTLATPKSNSCDATADRGNTARGKAILVTRSALLVRHDVENRIDATKNDQGRALIMTDMISSMRTARWLTWARPLLTSTPAEVMRSGMRIAHRNPITDCLYFTVMSRRVSM